MRRRQTATSSLRLGRKEVVQDCAWCLVVFSLLEAGTWDHRFENTARKITLIERLASAGGIRILGTGNRRVASLAASSALELPRRPLCPGIQASVTWTGSASMSAIISFAMGCWKRERKAQIAKIDDRESEHISIS